MPLLTLRKSHTKRLEGPADLAIERTSEFGNAVDIPIHPWNLVRFTHTKFDFWHENTGCCNACNLKTRISSQNFRNPQITISEFAITSMPAMGGKGSTCVVSKHLHACPLPHGRICSPSQWRPRGKTTSETYLRPRLARRLDPDGLGGRALKRHDRCRERAQIGHHNNADFQDVQL